MVGVWEKKLWGEGRKQQKTIEEAYKLSQDTATTSKNTRVIKRTIKRQAPDKGTEGPERDSTGRKGLVVSIRWA